MGFPFLVEFKLPEGRDLAIIFVFVAPTTQQYLAQSKPSINIW